MRPADCDVRPAPDPSDLRSAERSLDQAPMATTGSARIRRLQLTNFRSYRTAALAVEGDLVVLVGPNGVGKTNLIEAISFLAPGRGLRRATLDEVCFNEGAGDGGNDGAIYGSTNDSMNDSMSWAVAAEVEGALGLVTIGTGIDAVPTDEPFTRKCRVDREPVGSAAAFADHLRVVWLIPAMDGLFAGPAAERRRFLDRLVLAVDAEHGGRVNALERSLRSRNRLLEQPNPDPHWLDAVEHGTAELAVAVAAGRGRSGDWRADLLVTLPHPIRLFLSPRSRSTDGSKMRFAPRRQATSRTAIARRSERRARGTPPPAARSTGCI
jgi:recombinational DNA repair ATPase RecF